MFEIQLPEVVAEPIQELFAKQWQDKQGQPAIRFQ